MRNSQAQPVEIDAFVMRPGGGTVRLVYNEGQPISVSLEEGNGIFIQNGGSVEESIFIEQKNGKLIPCQLDVFVLHGC